MENFYYEKAEKLTAKEKYRSFGIGVLMVITGIAGMIAIKFISGNAFYYVRILSYAFIVFGALTMLRGILGQRLLSSSNFIEITGELITIKKSGQKKIVFDVDEIENLSVSGSSMLIKTKQKGEETVSLDFIPDDVLTELNIYFEEFCKRFGEIL